MKTWDIALSPQANKPGQMIVRMPTELARALINQGYNRATVTLTDDGILLTPYQRVRDPGPLELPNWSD